MSLLDDFINTTKQTISKNKMTPGGFAKNAAQGVGDLVGGVVNLVDPFSKTNPIRQVIQDPTQAGPMATNLIKNVGTSINNTVGQPVNPKTGQLQVPSLGEAENYFYNKPVDVAANLAMGAGAIAKGAEVAGMAGKAGDVSKAGEIAKGIDRAPAPKGFQSEGMKATGQPPVGSSMGLVHNAPLKAAETATESVPDAAASIYMKPYVVRDQVGKDINFGNTAKQMINDGVSGSLNDVDTHVQNVLNQTEKMKRDALSKASGPIKLDDAKSIIADSFNHKVPIGNKIAIPELAGNEARANAYRQTLEAYLPNNSEGSVSALDAYDSMRNIRNKGYDLIDQGQDNFGREINSEKVQVGKAYIDVAKAINDSLDKTLGDEKIFDQFKNSSYLDPIRQANPFVADRINNVNGWQEMQAVQKPYVDMAKIVRETKRATNTPGSKFTGQIADAITKTATTGGGAMMGGLPGLIGGNMVGQVVSPFIQQAVDHFTPQIMQGAAKIVNNVSQHGLPSLPGIPAIGTAGRLAAKDAVTPNVQPGQENNAPLDKAGQVAEQYPDAKADQNGDYSLPTEPTNKAGYVTEQDFEAATQGMTPGTPQYEEQLRRYNASKDLAKQNLSGSKMSFMQNAQDTLQTGHQVKQDLINLPPGFLNKFKSYSDMKKYFSNPQNPYAQELSDIDQFNTKFESSYADVTGNKPGENQLLAPTDSPSMVAQKWNRMQQFIVGNYQQNLDPFLALTSFGGQQKKPGIPQQASYVPQQQSDDASGMMQGGALPALQMPQVSLPPMGQ